MPLSQEDIVRTLLSARPRLSASIWVMLRDSQSAEDIFQNVSVKALTKGAIFEHEGLSSPGRTSQPGGRLDFLRKRRPESLLDHDVLEILDTEWRLEGHLASGGRMEALQDCLEKMPDHARRLLELRYFEGHSCLEVAEKLGLGIDAVYQRLSRLHRALKDCIEQKLNPGENLPILLQSHETDRF
ncbi:MAG: sigma-70 family RNA polymerase sigma factor [Verrucomicrobiales bacterium]